MQKYYIVNAMGSMVALQQLEDLVDQPAWVAEFDDVVVVQSLARFDPATHTLRL